MILLSSNPSLLVLFQFAKQGRPRCLLRKHRPLTTLLPKGNKIGISRKPETSPSWQSSSSNLSCAAPLTLNVQSYRLTQSRGPCRSSKVPLWTKSTVSDQPVPTIATVTRKFARSSSPVPPCEESPEDKARTYIISLGYERRIARGVVDALSQSGLSGGSLLSTVRNMAGRIEVGEDAGLEALIASVEQQLARTEGKQSVKFYCIPPSAWKSSEEYGDQKSDVEDNDNAARSGDDASFEVEGLEGMSITDVAKFGDGQGASILGEHLECACSGIMACSTCHVIVAKPWFHLVGEPSEAEQDMIDLAYNPTETSRLGCQVILRSELDGLVVKLPKGANNMMDHIPFED